MMPRGCAAIVADRLCGNTTFTLKFHTLHNQAFSPTDLSHRSISPHLLFFPRPHYLSLSTFLFQFLSLLSPLLPADISSLLLFLQPSYLALCSTRYKELNNRHVGQPG